MTYLHVYTMKVTRLHAWVYKVSSSNFKTRLHTIKNYDLILYMSQSCMGFKFQRWRTIKIMQLAIIIAFECQLEPPSNPLKKSIFT